jgi:DNA-binding NarL/FixJ family response regulator
MPDTRTIIETGRFARKEAEEQMESSSAPAQIRTLIVDDHGIVREGLAALLERSSRIKIVGMAATGAEAVSSASRLRPDVMIMDLMLPAMSGIDATRRILANLPRTRIVMLSACRTSEHIFLALRAGVRAYVLKECAGAELLGAVTAAHEGDRYLSPAVTDLVIQNVLNNSAPQSPLERLSSREREVLQLTAGGCSSSEIANLLSLSRKTVDTYRCRVMEKLGVRDRAHLIHFAIEHSLVPL